MAVETEAGRARPRLVTIIRGAFRDTERTVWAYRIALAVLIAFGFYFRSNRYWFDPIGLWGDESQWAARLFTHSLSDLAIRPIGFMAVSRALVNIYSDERMLRLLSYIAGLASLGIATVVGRQLFRSAIAQLLLVFIVAFHPVLIDMSREFKPYSLEFSVHLGLIALYLRFQATEKRAWLYALLACSIVSFLFAYNVAFLLPALVLLLAHRFLKFRSKRALIIVGIASVAALGVMSAVYSVSVSKLNTTKTERFWGNKYDAFYLENKHFAGKQPKTQVSWLFEKYKDFAAFPGEQRKHWKFGESTSDRTRLELRDIDRLGWILLHLIGVAVLIFRKEYGRLLLFLLPVGVAVFFNVLGIWPFDAFRVNTFLLVYFIIVPLFAVDALAAGSSGARWVGGTLAALLVVIPNVTVGFDTHSRKYALTFHAEFMRVFRHLRDHREQRVSERDATKETVLGDWYSCYAFDFYPEHHDGVKAEFGSYLKDNFSFQCAGTVKRTEARMRRMSGKEYWVVVTDNRVRGSMRAMIERRATILDERVIRQTHDVYWVRGN